MMFPIALIYLTQVCTGFDATLTANLQSFKEWKQGTFQQDLQGVNETWKY